MSDLPPSSRGPSQASTFPVTSLGDLARKDSIQELCDHFVALFGIPVRVYSAEGALFADAQTQHEICALANACSSGRSACGKVVDSVRRNESSASSQICFTGLVYRTVPIEVDAKTVGRVVFGPFARERTEEIPEALSLIDPSLGTLHARSLLRRVPVVETETLDRILKHFRSVLDLVLGAAHAARSTSDMHLLSVRESFRNLSEKNAELEAALAKLRDLDRAKSSFLATVTHELRTPLTSILGYSDMLSQGICGPLTAEQNEYIATIHAKGEDLLALITSMLDLSKLEAGRMTVKRESVDLAQVLSEVRTTLAPMAQRKKQVLVLDIEGPLPLVLGDGLRLRQVFTNLLENAVKFTPEGGEVRVSAVGATSRDPSLPGFTVMAPLSECVEVRIADTGIGIAPHERDQIFDPFYQVDASSTRAFGGAGIGLSLVDRLVRAHGGEVLVGANEPFGTEFTVILPGARAEANRSTSAPLPLREPS